MPILLPIQSEDGVTATCDWCNTLFCPMWDVTNYCGFNKRGEWRFTSYLHSFELFHPKEIRGHRYQENGTEHTWLSVSHTWTADIGIRKRMLVDRRVDYYLSDPQYCSGACKRKAAGRENLLKINQRRRTKCLQEAKHELRQVRSHLRKSKSNPAA